MVRRGVTRLHILSGYGQHLYVATDTDLQVLTLSAGTLSFAGDVPVAARVYDLAVRGSHARQGRFDTGADVLSTFVQKHAGE